MRRPSREWKRATEPESVSSWLDRAPRARDPREPSTRSAFCEIRFAPQRQLPAHTLRVMAATADAADGSASESESSAGRREPARMRGIDPPPDHLAVQAKTAAHHAGDASRRPTPPHG